MDKSLVQQLKHDRILLNPGDERDHTLLRSEVKDFAAAMHTGRGMHTDKPPMFCSALVDDPKHARDVTEFPDCTLMVVSIGGSNTHFRCLEIIGGAIRVRKEIKDKHPKHKMQTPCADGQFHTLEEMLLPVASECLPWLSLLQSEGKKPHILLNWGFPQQSVRLARDRGITGAIGQTMTKGQSKVAAEGREIHTVFKQCLFAAMANGNMSDDLLAETYADIKITVQNDTIMSVYRYLERWRRAKYRRIGLMIMGTGSNFTTAEAFLFDAKGRFLRDEGGFPVRVDHRGTDDTLSKQNVWINYEIGRLEFTHTRSRVDKLRSVEKKHYQEDIENFGLAGTGYGRIFKYLVFDYLKKGKKVWEQICQVFPFDERHGASGEWVVQLAGGHADKSPLALLHALRQVGLDDRQNEQLQQLAGVVVHRSALRAAEVLAAVSLFSGFGLHDWPKPDALAMEGSIWKTVHFQDKVLEFWSALLQPELKQLGREMVNIELIVEDDFNAGVLGPAYLLGQFS